MFTTRTFGIELEMAGLPFGADPVEVLRQAGIQVKLASYADRDATAWRIKPDGSLRGAPGCGQPFEVVSPVLSGGDGLAQAREVMEALEAAGAEINRTCGMHVHVDATDFSIDDFRKLGARWVTYEDVADSVMPESRRGSNNRYCRSNVRQMPGQDRLDAVHEQIDKIKRATTIREVHAQAQPTGRGSKLNFEPYWRQGTVEFRHHSGTANAEKALAWIEFVAAFTEHAKTSKKVTKPRKVGTDYTRTKQMMYQIGLDSQSWSTLRSRQKKFGFGQAA